jgi:hypothetical protein
VSDDKIAPPDLLIAGMVPDDAGLRHPLGSLFPAAQPCASPPYLSVYKGLPMSAMSILAQSAGALTDPHVLWRRRISTMRYNQTGNEAREA